MRLLSQIARAIHRLVQRHLALEGDDAPPDLRAAEQAAAVVTPPVAGRAAGPRPGRRSAFLEGYSLHADRLIEADDRAGLERLCRYGARAPIASARLARDPTGQVVMTLQRPLRDGRTALVFAPGEFVRRLATLIPLPRSHLTRYHGVFAPHHALRAAVVPAHAIPPANDPTPRAGPLRRLAWAALMKRVFAIDVLVCDTCGGPMRILAVLPAGAACRASLQHLGLATAPPEPRALAPPRPWFDGA